MLGTNTVLVFIIVAYGFAVLFASLLVLDVQRRRGLQHWMQRLGLRMTGAVKDSSANLQDVSRQSGRHLKSCCTSTLTFVARNRWHVFIATGMLGVPLAVVVCLQPFRSLSGYEDLPETSDPVVLALLRGEQLAPPPAMPPDAFITPEVAAVRQDLADASREWLAFDADFRQRLLTVFYLMAQKGYPMALLEGYRSPQRQTYLASLGPQVTNAGAFQSYHQFGLAADCAFVRNGKLVISEKDPWAMQAYRLYGELAESVGLVWGGRWRMMDFGHVELRKISLNKNNSIN